MSAIDWTDISALATGVGTLVLAVATFASVRSANRAARVAERSLQAGLRPLLVSGRPQDPAQPVRFVDDHRMTVQGEVAAVEVDGDVIYLAAAVRNAGTGVAVLDRWFLEPDRLTGSEARPAPAEQFRRLTRDLYVAAGDQGFWQGALRDRAEPGWEPLRDAIEARRPLTLDLLYADHEGGQRTVSRFLLLPEPGEDGGAGGRWVASTSRHWNLDREDPR